MPGFERVGRALVQAAADPLTWGPALGAGAMQIGDTDEEVADWASDNNPIFGSRDNAQTASDALRIASWGSYAAAGALAPADDDAWAAQKAKGFAVGGSAILATAGTTEVLKTSVDRERPNGTDTRSFPSAHTSTSAVSTRLAYDTLRYYDLSDGQRLAADVGLAGLTAATGWARVEAGVHYPSDVLAATAIGNFFAVFTTKAFLEPMTGTETRLSVAPVSDGALVSMGLDF
jgi:hypothetical protein